MDDHQAEQAEQLLPRPVRTFQAMRCCPNRSKFGMRGYIMVSQDRYNSDDEVRQLQILGRTNFPG